MLQNLIQATRSVAASALPVVWLFFFPPPAFAHEYDEQKLRQIANGRYWHLLLHYKKNLFGGVTSQVNRPMFFFSPTGRGDSYAELVATLTAFTQNTEIGNLKQNPQCAFPERYRYLKAELGFKIPEVECKAFKAWKARFNPNSVTLVFASSYMNNSASMFGHTFLRIDSKPRPQSDTKNDLLDYGINYGAMMGDDPLVQAVLYGLFGGYQGYFSQLPYFEKVNQYNNTESRDLWEYRLNLTAEQISRMINHIWEMDIAQFRYYFFNRNCSYHLLSLLEVANPEWHLTDQFFYWVIPSDTVRVLKKIEGSITQVTLRPSMYRQLNQKILALNAQEKADFYNKSGKSRNLTGKESALTLDALLDYQKYITTQSKKELDEAGKERQRQLLLARAKTETVERDLPLITAQNRPDLGVDSEKFSAYGGTKEGGRYFGLQIRPVYHDLLDLDAGYLHFGEINLARTDLRYYSDTTRFRVHEFEAVEIASLPPVDSIHHNLSWATQNGLYSPPDLDCRNCSAARLSGGVGYSTFFAPAQENVLFTSMVKGSFEYSGWFKDAIRVGPSWVTGVLMDLSTFGKFGLDGEIYYYPTQSVDTQVYKRITAQLSLNPIISLAKNFELRWSTSYYFLGRGNYFDQTGMLSWYF